MSVRLLRDGELDVLKKKGYRKNPKNSDTRKIAVNCVINHPKFLTRLLYHRVMCPIDADRMANSVDAHQTAPRGAV